jgi:hypothetical protein
MKAFWYLAVVVCGALGALGALRAIELLLFKGFSAYGAGRLAGTLLMAVLFLLLAGKALGKARAA